MPPDGPLKRIRALERGTHRNVRRNANTTAHTPQRVPGWRAANAPTANAHTTSRTATFICSQEAWNMSRSCLSQAQAQPAQYYSPRSPLPYLGGFLCRCAVAPECAGVCGDRGFESDPQVSSHIVITPSRYIRESCALWRRPPHALPRCTSISASIPRCRCRATYALPALRAPSRDHSSPSVPAKISCTCH